MSSPPDARIWLVGPPGAGKTTVGRQLAAVLSWSFVDLDEVIEHQAGCSIADLFKAAGETGFRERERQALELQAADSSREVVIATGAGVVEDEGLRRLLTGSGLVLWLDLPVEQALERCRGAAAGRPLLADEKDYRQRLEARVPLYRAVGLRVDAGLPADEVVAACRKLIAADA